MKEQFVDVAEVTGLRWGWAAAGGQRQISSSLQLDGIKVL